MRKLINVELCLARAVRVGAVLTCLLALVVGGFVTLGLASWSWQSFRDSDPLWVGAVLTAAATLTPVAAAVGWRCSSGLSRFERLTATGAVTLPVALFVGVLIFVWVATPRI